MIRFILIFCAWVIANEADHLLLTHVVTQPTAAESFSIYNPTDSPINLNDYYICDDEDYYEMQTDGDMSPSHFINGFTARFPNINIDPKGTLIIGLNYQYNEFYGENFPFHIYISLRFLLLLQKVYRYFLIFCLFYVCP